MAKSIQKKLISSYVFWIFIAVMVLFLVVGSIIIISSNNYKKYKSYEDLNELIGDDVFYRNPTEGSIYNEYYVIMYTRDDSTNISRESSLASKDLEQVILNYANYYYNNIERLQKEERRTKDLSDDKKFVIPDNFLNIFSCDLDNHANKTLLTQDTTIVNYSGDLSTIKINQKTMPVLFKVVNGQNKEQYVGVNAISKFLTETLEKVANK